MGLGKTAVSLRDRLLRGLEERLGERPLRAGFGLVMGLFLFVAVIALTQLEVAQSRLESIVDGHMAKTALVTDMHNAARERTLSLQRMLLYTDVFERDEVWVRFNELGGGFARARAQLTELPLTERETVLLREQGELTGTAVPLQLEVISLIGDGKTREAHQMLVKRAIPAQDRVLAKLDELRGEQTRAANQAADRARRLHAITRAVLGTVLVLAVLVGLLVAHASERRTRGIERRLSREKDRAQVTLHAISDGVIRTGLDGNIEYMNPVAERLVGYKLAQVRGQLFANVVRLHDDQRNEAVHDPVAQAIATDSTVSLLDDIALMTPDGRRFAVEVIATPILDAEENTAGVVVVIHDVTEMRALARELGFQASHDALTGLPNRREFERRLQELLNDVRYTTVQHAICYFDLDLFKAVNDTCGHMAGDELLRQLGARLHTSLREGDFLARLGGDEFGMLLTDRNLDDAGRRANQLVEEIRAWRFCWDDKRFEVSASVGVAAITGASNTVHDVLRIVDLACYAAKEQGRGRVHVARRGDREIADRQGEFRIMQTITEALESNRFTLYAQEIQALRHDDGHRHFEVLVRMRDTEGGIIAPVAFLPTAERYHMMPMIDRWVIRETLALLTDARNQAALSNAHFSINLSGQSLSEPGFMVFVVDAIRDSGIAPERICFEITETAAVSNMALALRFIERLREFGCRFALDDFGSGMSSFAYLKNLPVDYLKIDGAFIRDIISDRTNRAMVASIQELATLLGIRTIAEYVESREIWQQITNMDVDYAQGYAVAHPTSLVELLRASDRPSVAGA